MFTIKLYRGSSRQIIEEADSFTILRSDDGTAEITLHRNVGPDVRRDIKDEDENIRKASCEPPCFDRAIIENSAGRTTEIVCLRHNPAGRKNKEAA